MDLSEALEEALAALDLEATRDGLRSWSLPLPSLARRSFGVGMVCAERTLTLTAFFMRRPDRDAEGVYGRLLRKNLDMAGWRFAVDDHGDLYLIAQLEAPEVTAGRLDEVLGLLVTYVDEMFEPVMRQGFDVPPGMQVTGGPPAR